MSDAPSTSELPTTRRPRFLKLRVAVDILCLAAFTVIAVLLGPLVAAVFALLAVYAASGRRPRFSVRSLLIVTTIIAIVLGLMVWAGR